MMIKRIDELGRIAITAEMREKLNLTPKTYVSIDEIDGKIIIETAGKPCKLCGASGVSLSEFGICAECTEKIKQN